MADTESWAESTSAFFNLSSAKLAGALQKAMPMEDLSPEQQLYARAVLLNVASVGTTIMDEEARPNAVARKNSPVYSMGRAGQYEAALYKLIDKGDVEGVKRTTQRQIITTTAHPNFSRSRNLSKECRKLSEALGNLSGAAQKTIETSGELPADQQANIQGMLANIKGMLKSREKRLREDELQETVLDIVPIAMKAAKEQVKIFKQRKAVFDTKKPQDVAFSSVKQLEAMAALLPEYNSWCMDGDGKRSCHVYDAELAIPAIKRFTYQEYSHLLDILDRINTNEGFDFSAWREKIESRIQIFKEVEKLATVRMNALNEMQQNSSEQAIENAREASGKYLAFLKSTTVEGNKVSDVLKEDFATPLKTALGEMLDKAYKTPDSFDKAFREQAEELYIKLAAYGNYAVRLQRRENARDYREVFNYLIKRSERIKEAVAKELGVKKTKLTDALSEPDNYLKAAQFMAEHVMSKKDELHIGESIRDLFVEWAGTMEKNKYDINPLEPKELLALDALGCFNIAAMYPEAFKGGFIVAEFAQPHPKTLSNSTPDQIQKEVVQKAQTDMLAQLTFCHAMGAPDAEIIPLHEDPATMKYIPAAQALLREDGPIKNYLLKWIGADTPKKAEKNAVRYINEKGKPEMMTAYHYLRRYGVTSYDMGRAGLDPHKLQKTYVLEGPYDMEACSDNNKRSSIIGSLLAEESIREKTIEAMKHPVAIGVKDYVIVKPKYLGQGGSIARATEVPIDSQQATWQGEQLASLTPKSLAHKSYNYMLGRLTLNQEAALDEGRRDLTLDVLPAGNDPTADYGEAWFRMHHEKSSSNERIANKFRDRVAGTPGHVGNALGMAGPLLTEDQRALLHKTIDMRIASTRDDEERYNAFLDKYGQPAPNYSARADAKNGSNGTAEHKTKKSDFSNERAIGVAAKEMGIWANVIGITELFDFGTRGKGKGRLSDDSIKEIKEWMKQNPILQQIMTGGAFIANMVNLKETWLRGGIAYEANENGGTLTKNGTTVPVADLKEAYDSGQKEFAKNGVVFDAGDLVMAHLTDQFHKLEKGLLAVYPNNQGLPGIFAPEHRETVEAYKKLSDDILQRLRETKDNKDPDRELLKGSYYMVFESGNMFPPLSLLEQGLYNQR